MEASEGATMPREGPLRLPGLYRNSVFSTWSTNHAASSASGVATCEGPLNIDGT
eukprot:NODE_29296_length_450_cov_2.195046.p2 GENE.NODE_29296_length_450_cov_2.195046~~NODE_29296_length_450_cov_2.195046.p2  ORF type:complete len:54 (+),score=5.99 NODE_29296_length_450_cov_2.195046:109-270(+)